TRILNAEIRVGLSDDISENSQCGEKITSSQTSQANIHIQCSSPIVGRYVSMQLVDRSDLLNFCEMQVMAEGSQPALENVAIGKTAMQSSDWSASYPASNGVDGNTNTNWNSGSCTSTKDNQNAWWKVDLGGNYLVHEVIVTNRLDCCETRILNAEIRVGLSDDISENSQCGEKITSSQTSQANIHIQCSSPIVGRYVSMQLVDRSDLLNFCEMQVMAEVPLLMEAEDEAIGSEKPMLHENVGLKGTASQSSTAYDGPAHYANDGNDDSIYGDQSCSHTAKEQGAWWKLDLGETYSISQVVITNRQDCCSERIDGAVVLIGGNSDLSQNDQCGDQIDWNANTYGEKITLDCQLNGRYVGVQLKDHNNYLHMCEVEVFGKKHHKTTPCSLNWTY
ncbi:uncharacterized protein LOC102808061, partial [Saccoglossus kowalevskii]|uniref:Uncharacterized protein LOC102808061 n=1 Tax=Saccoglossus kowalevskii TaxID=10224 RepID=A0ABM0MEM5_SACKO